MIEESIEPLLSLEIFTAGRSDGVKNPNPEAESQDALPVP
jgi:hypothetical protein